MKVGIYYFRSLFSQSACSLSVSKFSDLLINRGYNVNLGILKTDDYSYNRDQISHIIENDIIVYKVNYKDFEYGIRFFKNIKDFYKDKKIYITGPFASLNSDRILNKYHFINGIINIQDSNQIATFFPKLEEVIRKETLIYGRDREMEFLEKGAYVNLEATTGCIYNCAFCHINILKYPKETIDISRLVNEIDFLVNSMNKKYLIFNDSVFWKNENDTKRILEIIQEIKNRNIKFYFMIYLSLTSKIPMDLLDALKSIGLIRVFFGVENISKDFQQLNNKYISGDDTKEFINELKIRNISYHVGFILFSYDTNYNDLILNLKFLRDIKKLFRPRYISRKNENSS